MFVRGECWTGSREGGRGTHIECFCVGRELSWRIERRMAGPVRIPFKMDKMAIFNALETNLYDCAYKKPKNIKLDKLFHNNSVWMANIAYGAVAAAAAIRAGLNWCGAAIIVTNRFDTHYLGYYRALLDS